MNVSMVIHQIDRCRITRIKLNTTTCFESKFRCPFMDGNIRCQTVQQYFSILSQKQKEKVEAHNVYTTPRPGEEEKRCI